MDPILPEALLGQLGPPSGELNAIPNSAAIALRFLVQEHDRRSARASSIVQLGISAQMDVYVDLAAGNVS